MENVFKVHIWYWGGPKLLSKAARAETSKGEEERSCRKGSMNIQVH